MQWLGMSPVRFHGKSYSKKAWRLAYSYAGKGKEPDANFEKRMKKLGVSRSDAYELYRAILYSPREIEFIEKRKAKPEAKFALAIKEEVEAQVNRT